MKTASRSTLPPRGLSHERCAAGSHTCTRPPAAPHHTTPIGRAPPSHTDAPRTQIVCKGKTPRASGGYKKSAKRRTPRHTISSLLGPAAAKTARGLCGGFGCASP